MLILYLALCWKCLSTPGVFLVAFISCTKLYYLKIGKFWILPLLVVFTSISFSCLITPAMTVYWIRAENRHLYLVHDINRFAYIAFVMLRDFFSSSQYSPGLLRPCLYLLQWPCDFYPFHILHNSCTTGIEPTRSWWMIFLLCAFILFANILLRILSTYVHSSERLGYSWQILFFFIIFTCFWYLSKLAL